MGGDRKMGYMIAWTVKVSDDVKKRIKGLTDRLETTLPNVLGDMVEVLSLIHI